MTPHLSRASSVAWALACACVGFGAALPTVSFAQYRAFKNLSSAAHPLDYRIDDRPGVTPLAPSAVAEAVQRAWGAWNAVSCAVPKARSIGGTRGVVPRVTDTADVHSVTPVWISQAVDPDEASELGQFITSRAFALSYAGVLATCDVWLNADAVSWSTASQTAPSDVDLESVMAYEAGHCLGLAQDLSATHSVMDHVPEPGEQRRGPFQDDVDNLCWRYPLTGAVGAPCTAEGTCGAEPGLACVDRAVAAWGILRHCSVGCQPGTGNVCPFPTRCEPSSAFSPAAAGACLLPETTETDVGRACGDETVCGSASAFCLGEDLQPSGAPLWRGGYCSQGCEEGQAPCPVEDVCVAFVDGVKRCLAGCDVGVASCREGYACTPLGERGVCVSRCASDDDCLDTVGSQCRLCDGVCIARQNPAGQIGDACTVDATCGPGQVCRAVDARGALEVCTEPCALGCANCPSGSACHSAGASGAERLCLRTCSGVGTCPSGLRCAALAAGLACVPGCASAADCPSGQTCAGGECVPSAVDGGCAGACGVDAGPGGAADAGARRDGGLGGGTAATSGCGCGAVGASFDVLLALVAFLALGRVRAGAAGSRRRSAS